MQLWGRLHRSKPCGPAQGRGLGRATLASHRPAEETRKRHLTSGPWAERPAPNLVQPQTATNPIKLEMRSTSSACAHLAGAVVVLVVMVVLLVVVSVMVVLAVVVVVAAVMVVVVVVIMLAVVVAVMVLAVVVVVAVMVVVVTVTVLVVGSFSSARGAKPDSQPGWHRGAGREDSAMAQEDFLQAVHGDQTDRDGSVFSRPQQSTQRS